MQTSNTSSQMSFASSEIIKIKVDSSPGSIEIADFNNEKFPDLAITSETDSSVTILLENGKNHLLRRSFEIIF
jgi:hypothetical protein